MKTAKNKSIENIKSAMNSATKTAEIGRLNAFKRLCAAYISTGDSKQREKAIKKVIRQESGLNEMLRQNDEILTADLERALMELALGCTVTEERVKTGTGGKTIEKITKQLPPNQAAAEFLLINRTPERFSRNPEPIKNDGEGRINEILEALKNVK